MSRSRRSGTFQRMSLRRPLFAAVITLVVAAGGAFAAVSVAFAMDKPHATALPRSSDVRIGPGPATARVQEQGYRLDVRLSPNRALASNELLLRLTRNGESVNAAGIRVAFTMLDMHMPEFSASLAETAPGKYGQAVPRLMFGRWGVRLFVLPRGETPFSVRLIDRVGV